MSTLPTKQLVVVLCATIIGVSAAARGASEVSPSQNVTASYTPGAKVVDISLDGKIVNESLRGYQATDLLVIKNGSSSKTVLFLDDQGISVGGDLRVFVTSGDHLVEINNDYSANQVSLENLGGAKYIVLWQHDTKDLYYASDLLQVEDDHLRASASREPWLALVHDKYQPNIKQKTDSFSLSRYDYYIGSIYLKLGDKSSARTYLARADKLDPGNRQIKRALGRLSTWNAH